MTLSWRIVVAATLFAGVDCRLGGAKPLGETGRDSEPADTPEDEHGTDLDRADVQLVGESEGD